jgi:hypothetical protein
MKDAQGNVALPPSWWEEACPGEGRRRATHGFAACVRQVMDGAPSRTMTGRGVHPGTMTGRGVHPRTMTGRGVHPGTMTGRGVHPGTMTGRGVHRL